MRRLRLLSRFVFGFLFVLAGINHLLRPAFYARMIPLWLPWPAMLVVVSGAIEILLGLLLLIRRYSRLAAWGLIALLVAVFPANLHMALHPELFPSISRTGLLLRLPVQGLLIAWAFLYTRFHDAQNS